MLWFKQYKLVFVILLLILFIALFIRLPSSVEGFDSGYSAIIAADVVFKASLDKLIGLKIGFLSIVKPTLPLEDDFNSHSANATTYKTQLSSLKTQMSKY